MWTSTTFCIKQLEYNLLRALRNECSFFWGGIFFMGYLTCFTWNKLSIPLASIISVFSIGKRKRHSQMSVLSNQQLSILPGRFQPRTFDVYEAANQNFDVFPKFFVSRFVSIAMLTSFKLYMTNY